MLDNVAFKNFQRAKINEKFVNFLCAGHGM